jgi:hypothetical protein
MASLNLRSYIKEDASETNQASTSVVRYKLGQLRLRMHHNTSREAYPPGGMNGDFVFCARGQDAEVDYQSNLSLADVRKHAI